MKFTNLIFRFHAIQRMFKRAITVDEVKEALDNGEIIESYPDDWPLPSSLVLGYSGDRPLHIVTAEDAKNESLIIITVYEPDPELWEDGFKRRKQQ